MNITIVGGGTAGWITALYVNQTFPEYKITLIESKEIGILGAGEASTPHLIDFLNFVKIPVSDLIKYTNATVKTTAKFTGWSKNYNEFFYHPFEYIKKDFSEQHGYFNVEGLLDTNLFHLYSYANDISMDEYCFINKICNKNHVPFLKTNNFTDVTPLLNYQQLGGWSLNFDAKLLADYFSNIAQKRGVRRIEGKVKHVSLNLDGEITDLLLEDNQFVNSDFVFDCTGFARLIIGKKYLSKWISYKEYLPTNKALPFFLDNKQDKEIPPYIEAIAMNYGWMWKTPLQNRYGCGYVFDSNYISVDEAKQEVESLLKFEIFPPKIFSFEPGTYEKIWIKNCLAVGLSAGFIEPLEATSIMQTLLNLQRFFSNKHNILTKNNYIKDSFNLSNEVTSYSIVEYVYWHYVTNKENTLFWKNFTKNNKLPDLIENILNIIQERVLCQTDFVLHKNSYFCIEDFLYVLFGHKLIDKNLLKKYKNEIKYITDKHKRIITLQNTQLTTSHNAFLNHLKNN